MKISDLAELLGKTREEVESMLKASDVVEVKLNDKEMKLDNDDLNIMS